MQRQYCVDSDSCTLIFVKVDEIRNLLDVKGGLSDVERVGLYQELCRELLNVSADFLETFETSLLTKEKRFAWALQRFEELMPHPYPISRRRFGSHMLSNDLSVSKLIKIVRDSGEYTKYACGLFR